MDSKGYALFGTPGPGQYDTITQFNDGKLRQSSKGGKHVFPMHGKFSIQGKQNTQEITPDSPGPAAHTPDFKVVSPHCKSAVMGTSTRAGEARRFVSHAATPQMPDGVPDRGHIGTVVGKVKPGPWEMLHMRLLGRPPGHRCPLQLLEICLEASMTYHPHLDLDLMLALDQPIPHGAGLREIVCKRHMPVRIFTMD